MSTANGRSAGRALRRIPSRAVLAGLTLVGLFTIVSAILNWWDAALIGIVLLHLGTALAVLGPWGIQPVTNSSKGAEARLTAHVIDLEQRVDALDSRLVATTERTRVELLDALSRRTGGAEDRPS